MASYTITQKAVRAQQNKLGHRHPAYRVLSGQGLEIGALHLPALLPSRCKVAYCDYMTTEDSTVLYDELDPTTLVRVSHLCDLDRGDLRTVFSKSVFDFCVFNHVVEHVANPIPNLSPALAYLDLQGHR